MKQKTLFKLSQFSSEFGGSLNLEKRKSRRPLSTKYAIHLVLRANIKKSGSLLLYRSKIDTYFPLFASKFGVNIYKKAIVSNHIHITARFYSSSSYKMFIRALTGSLSKVLKIKWEFRPFTRILKWGRAFQIALKYVEQNHLEAIGEIPFQKRNKRLYESRI